MSGCNMKPVSGSASSKINRSTYATHTITTYIVMAYKVMAGIVIACMVMAYIAMAYIGLYSYCVLEDQPLDLCNTCSYDLYSYVL